MRRADLIRQLGELIGDLEPVTSGIEPPDHLRAMCYTARCAFGAAAVSVSVVGDDALRYVAADGEGAAQIVGTLLPAGRGIAGYVALTGQSLAVDRATNDPRFAREVAESTGYLPTTMLVVPVVEANGDVIGVLSVLDRKMTTGDALELASAFAAQAALILPNIGQFGRTSRLLLGAIVEAVRSGDRDLGDALQRAVGQLPEGDGDLARIAAILADLRGADPAVRSRVLSVLAEIVALARIRERR